MVDGVALRLRLPAQRAPRAWQSSGHVKDSCTGARLCEPQQRPNCRRRQLFFDCALARQIAAGRRPALRWPEFAEATRPLQAFVGVSWWNSGKKKAGHYSGHFTTNTPTGYSIPHFPKVTLLIILGVHKASAPRPLGGEGWE